MRLLRRWLVPWSLQRGLTALQSGEHFIQSLHPAASTRACMLAAQREAEDQSMRHLALMPLSHLSRPGFQPTCAVHHLRQPNTKLPSRLSGRANLCMLFSSSLGYFPCALRQCTDEAQLASCRSDGHASPAAALQCTLSALTAARELAAMSSSTNDIAQTGSMLHTMTLVDSMAPAGRQAVALALAMVPGALQSLLNVLKVRLCMHGTATQGSTRAFVDIPLTLLQHAAIAALLTIKWVLACCHAATVNSSLCH